MLLKTIRKFLKKFHLFGCHQKKNDEFPANQSTVLWPWPHTDEPRQQKVTMSSLNSNWVNISYWQQQQYCGYIFTAPTVTRDKKHHHQQEEQEKYGRDRNVLRPETKRIAFIDLAWVVFLWLWKWIKIHLFSWLFKLWFLEQEMWSGQMPGRYATRCDKCALITAGVKLRRR